MINQHPVRAHLCVCVCVCSHHSRVSVSGIQGVDFSMEELLGIFWRSVIYGDDLDGHLTDTGRQEHRPRNRQTDRPRSRQSTGKQADRQMIRIERQTCRQTGKQTDSANSIVTVPHSLVLYSMALYSDTLLDSTQLCSTLLWSVGSVPCCGSCCAGRWPACSSGRSCWEWRIPGRPWRRLQRQSS